MSVNVQRPQIPNDSCRQPLFVIPNSTANAGNLNWRSELGAPQGTLMAQEIDREGPLEGSNFFVAHIGGGAL